jgi:hypothetical protein
LNKRSNETSSNPAAAAVLPPSFSSYLLSVFIVNNKIGFFDFEEFLCCSFLFLHFLIFSHKGHGIGGQD